MKELKELISKKQLNKRLSELATQLDKDYEGKEIIALCVMRGSVFFATDLTLKMKTKMKLDFITVSSYQGTENSGNIELVENLRESIKDKDVLVIEDIIDTGKTMSYLLEYLKTKEPKSLKLCVLADKPSRREVEVPIDYIGFEVPNKYIVGYGFDIDNYYRNIPYIGYIDEDENSKEHHKIRKRKKH